MASTSLTDQILRRVHLSTKSRRSILKIYPGNRQLRLEEGTRIATLCVWGRFAREAAGPQLRLRQLSESPPSPLLRQIHMAAGRLLTEVLTCFSQTRIPAGKYSGQSHPDKQHWNLNHCVFKSIRLKFNTINN